jgi:hypothetical protein
MTEHQTLQYDRPSGGLTLVEQIKRIGDDLGISSDGLTIRAFVDLAASTTGIELSGPIVQQVNTIWRELYGTTSVPEAPPSKQPAERPVPKPRNKPIVVRPSKPKNDTIVNDRPIDPVSQPVDSQSVDQPAWENNQQCIAIAQSSGRRCMKTTRRPDHRCNYHLPACDHVTTTSSGYQIRCNTAVTEEPLTSTKCIKHTEFECGVLNTRTGERCETIVLGNALCQEHAKDTTCCVCLKDIPDSCVRYSHGKQEVCKAVICESCRHSLRHDSTCPVCRKHNLWHSRRLCLL